MLLLAGDIGGTKTELALYDGHEPGVELDSRRFPSRDYASFSDVLREFLAGRRVAAAGIGVAGPVIDGRCKATNLPWQLDERELSKELGAPVLLGNDFWFNVLGIPELATNDLQFLAANPR